MSKIATILTPAELRGVRVCLDTLRESREITALCSLRVWTIFALRASPEEMPEDLADLAAAREAFPGLNPPARECPRCGDQICGDEICCPGCNWPAAND